MAFPRPSGPSLFFYMGARKTSKGAHLIPFEICADCGVVICAGCRMSCCGESFCHLPRDSCLRKPVQNKLNPLPVASRPCLTWPASSDEYYNRFTLKAQDFAPPQPNSQCSRTLAFGIKNAPSCRKVGKCLAPAPNKYLPRGPRERLWHVPNASPYRRRFAIGQRVSDIGVRG